MSSSKNKSHIFRRLRTRALVTVMGTVVLLTGSLNVHAIGPVQETGPALFQHIMNQVNSYLAKAQSAAEFGKENTRWIRTLQQYKQELTKMANFFDMTKLPVLLDLEERAENYGMKERCPSANGGLSVSGIVTMVTPDIKGDIASQQLHICQLTVVLENRKYNALVGMVKNAKDRQSDIDKLTRNFTSSEDPGAVAANQAQAQALMGQSLSEIQYSTSKIQAYDGMVAALERDQKVLATSAFKGEKNMLGTIIKTATLAGALKVNESN